MNAVGWIDTGKEAHYQLDPSVTFPLDGSEEAASAHQRLRALLSRCDAVLDGDNCPELRLPVPASGQQRDPYDPRCYGSQSVFLVRHCYLLLAFTNGVTSRKVGGTSQTVAMQPHTWLPDTTTRPVATERVSPDWVGKEP